MFPKGGGDQPWWGPQKNGEVLRQSGGKRSRCPLGNRSIADSKHTEREHKQTGANALQHTTLSDSSLPRPRIDNEDYLRARRLCGNVVGPRRSILVSFCFASPATRRQHSHVEVRMFLFFGCRSRRSDRPRCLPSPPQRQQQQQQCPTCWR